MNKKITIKNLPLFEKFIAKLNRKAKKFGIDELTYSIEKRLVPVGVHKQEVLEVVLDGSPFEMNGWSYVASAEDTPNGNIIRKNFKSKDLRVPDRYHEVHNICEHCNCKRKRKLTYVLRNDVEDSWKMVGSSCMEDFIDGSKNAFKFVDSLDEQIENYVKTEKSSVTKEGLPYGMVYDNLTTLTFTALAIEKYGWVSSGEAYANHTRSTKVAVYDLMNGCDEHSKSVNKDHQALAMDAIKWVCEYDESLCDTYMKNLKTIVKNGYSPYSQLGYLVSIINTYQRKKSESKRKDLSLSKHVGAVRDKLSLAVKSMHCFNCNGMYGEYNVSILADDCGNVYKTNMFTEKEKTYDITGTVKDHTEYKGIKQTVLTRVKVK